MKKKEIFKKVAVISLSIILALVIFVGFSLAQEKEIRMGAIVDLSGPLSQFGPDWLKAGEMAAKEINSLGGLFGSKHKIIC